MRAPATSFKSELAAYRQRLEASHQELGPHWKCQLALEVLDRWEKHADVEKIWDTIRPKLPTDPSVAGQFIATVLLHRIKAREIEAVIARLPDVVTKNKARTRRHLDAGNYADLVNENALLGAAVAARSRLLSRETTVAARNRFMVFLRSTFQKLCGQPHHGIVASLTEIAFDCSVPLEAVVDAARRTACRPRRPRTP